jgi:uncharacterized membrane protein YphA (DoxX/SURF4 family)
MNFSPSNKNWARVALALRIVLGMIFVYAAYLKLHESWRLFAMSIDSYQIVHSVFLETWIAKTLPWLELALGLWLIAGFWLRGSATITALLLSGFFGLMIWAHFKGLEIDCGCFGPGEKISWITMLRDGSLLAGALALAAWSYFGNRRARHSQPGEVAV